jgi:hypothetical protein
MAFTYLRENDEINSTDISSYLKCVSLVNSSEWKVVCVANAELVDEEN